MQNRWHFDEWFTTENFYFEFKKNFFSKSKELVGLETFRISYVSNATSISRITVVINKLDDIRLKIQCNPFQSNEFTFACEKIFPKENIIRMYDGEMEITFNSSQIIDALKEVFLYFSKEFKQTDIDDLINELTNLYDLIQTVASQTQKPPDFKKINSLAKTTLHVRTLERPFDNINPSYTNSDAMYNFIHKWNNQLRSNKQSILQAKREFAELLIRGENLNQPLNNKKYFIDKGRTIVFYLLYYPDHFYLKMALHYGANLTTRFHKQLNRNAFEEAKLYSSPEILELISIAMTPLEKPRYINPITKSMVMLVNNNIKSSFEFEKGEKIQTFVKPAEKLSPEENKQVKTIFKKNFTTENSEDLKEILFEDIDTTESNKLIEVIYNEDKDKLFAFNVYRIMPSKTFKDHVFLYFMYSAIDPSSNNKGAGLMYLLFHRPAFSLQLLNEHLTVNTFYYALNYPSYRWAAGDQIGKALIHYPMYQSKYAKELVHDITHQVEEDTSIIHQDGLSCYIKDSLKVIYRDPIKSNTDLLRQFFYHYLLDDPKTENRSAIVMLPVSNQSFQHVKTAASLLGISFLNHCQQFALALQYVIKLPSNKPTLYKNPKSFVNHQWLFWANKRKSDLSIDLPFTHLRSKL